MVIADATAEEFHFALQCLFPLIRGIPYEFCKAMGPGNVVLVPLTMSDERMKPRRNQPFRPFFSVRELKEAIGRKGKLYIRPLQLIAFGKCPRLTDHEICSLISQSISERDAVCSSWVVGGLRSNNCSQAL